ncbi:F-box/kelch-repeat protein At3g23880-like isoform X2 [Alnus glutinosa]|uniref:F-box/kelch-repeat protein At3g23880-like isoform X2 n=1 Tax=Alnus glutinosa TaxID=3517 RepID=UPI002D7A2599|nr:F-box/kelch-repeat protein At3g23880-like isoform X2 [Alnus glutinosa]
MPRRAKVGRMASYLPEEVVVKILSRLPPKCLIRFKSVSKRWRALIGSPDFLSKNLLNDSILTQNPSHPLRHILLFARDKYDLGTLIHSFRSYDSLHCVPQTPLNLPTAPPPFDVVASCNGLLCLWAVTLSNIYLWNPATSSDLEALPAAPSRCHTGLRVSNPDFGFHNVGFGFDAGSNDFKVVTLVDTDEDGWLEAEIYSLKSGSWRPLDMSVNIEIHLVSQSAALDGVFLWYDDYTYDDCVDDRIVVFDFNDEEFQIMQFPDASLFCDYDEYTRTLTELKGSVAMMVFALDDDEKKKDLEIWVMLEFGVSESWTRLLIIQLPLHLERPLRFWKNGELLMENNEGQVVLYDLLVQTETNLQFEGYRGTLIVVDCNFFQFEGMGSGVIPTPSCSCCLHYATQFNDHEDCRRKQQEIEQKLEDTQILLRDMQEGLEGALEVIQAKATCEWGVAASESSRKRLMIGLKD